MDPLRSRQLAPSAALEGSRRGLLLLACSATEPTEEVIDVVSSVADEEHCESSDVSHGSSPRCGQPLVVGQFERR